VTGAVVAGAGAGGATAWVGGATAWVGGVVAVVGGLGGLVVAVTVDEDGAAETPWSERTRALALAADRAGVRADPR
jgi:hypothetical protein